MKYLERVRRDYAEAARRVSDGMDCECSSTPGIGAAVYAIEHLRAAPEGAAIASIGCGNPVVVADLHEGDVVLDLGSGGGLDALLSARRVGPTGKVFGLDMTEEMLELARRHAAEAGVENVEFIQGLMEEIPLADTSVDVVISNCVISLAADKRQVFREASRLLRPGGRFAITDVVVDEDVSAEERGRLSNAACLGTALTRAGFEIELAAAGFGAIDIRETHRVHERAGSAIVRARKE